MSEPLRWRCVNGHENEGGRHCPVQGCGQILSEKQARQIDRRQRRERWLPAAPEVDEGRPRPLVSVGIVLAATVLVALALVPGVGGRVYLVSRVPAPGPCSGACPSDGPAAVRVRSRGIARGPGGWGLGSQVYVSLPGVRAQGSDIVLHRGRHVSAGRVHRSGRGPLWVVEVVDRRSGETIVAAPGPRHGRTAVTLLDAVDLDAVEVDGHRVEVMDVAGPLSQVPAALQVGGLLLVALGCAARVTAAGIRRAARTALAAIAVLVAGSLRPSIHQEVGRAFGAPAYSSVGMVIAMAMLALGLALPALAYAGFRGIVARLLPLASISAGPPLWWRLVAGALVGAALLVMLPVADQALGALLLGWQA